MEGLGAFLADHWTFYRHGLLFAVEGMLLGGIAFIIGHKIGEVILAAGKAAWNRLFN